LARIHIVHIINYDEIGSLLGLSNLFKKSQPIPTGILSGLGKGLAMDDYGDRREWFTFKKKEHSHSNITTKPTQTVVSDMGEGR